MSKEKSAVFKGLVILIILFVVSILIPTIAAVVTLIQVFFSIALGGCVACVIWVIAIFPIVIKWGKSMEQQE